jgi:SP family sugar:H+ symporter-like MFS transporter
MARDQSDVSALVSGPTGRSTAHIVLIAATAALGGFLFGFDTAIINGAVSAIGSHFHAGALALGQAVASALLGSAVGAFFAGRWADRLGRIPVMVIAAILFFISAIGSGLAFSLWELTLFRLVGGLGVGTASVIAPAYIAEIAPADLRGRLGSLQQLAIVSGIFVALLLDYFFATAAGNSLHVLWLGLAAWRWMFLSGCVPAAIYGCLSLSIPESPRFLVAQMRDPQAIKVLDMVVGPSEAEHKLAEIRATLGNKQSRSLRDLKGPAFGLLPIVWIGIALSALQQFVGINVIFYYSSVLWQAVGFSEKDSLVITVITSVTNILTTLVAIALVDKIGRKALLLIGSTGMFLTLGTMALAFGTAPSLHGEPHLGPLAGADRAVRGQRLRVLLRDVVGAGRLGTARRDVQQPHPGDRPVRRGSGPVDRQLDRVGVLPVAQGRRAGLRLRAVHSRGVHLALLRDEVGEGDQGPRARIHVAGHPRGVRRSRSARLPGGRARQWIRRAS